MTNESATIAIAPPKRIFASVVAGPHVEGAPDLAKIVGADNDVVARGVAGKDRQAERSKQRKRSDCNDQINMGITMGRFVFGL